MTYEEVEKFLVERLEVAVKDLMGQNPMKPNTHTDDEFFTKYYREYAKQNAIDRDLYLSKALEMIRQLKYEDRGQYYEY